MVDKIPSMVDMAFSQEEKEDFSKPTLPRYPYGLCLSLCQDELDKLGIEIGDVGVGDMLHLHCLAKVTSVSSNENENGSSSRVELQVTHIAAEDEDEENKEVDKKTRKLYR